MLTGPVVQAERKTQRVGHTLKGIGRGLGAAAEDFIAQHAIVGRLGCSFQGAVGLQEEIPAGSRRDATVDDGARQGVVDMGVERGSIDGIETCLMLLVDNHDS